jgi:hypothetical protein
MICCKKTEKKAVYQMESNVILLNEEQRNTLKKYVNTGTHSAMLIRRARVILALDRSEKKDHLRIGRICESNEVSRQAVYDIRNDFLSAPNIETFLARKKRETPPIAPKITGDVEAHVIALACGEVPNGCARWTVKLLCEKSVELGYIDHIAQSTMHTLLKKRNISLI